MAQETLCQLAPRPARRTEFGFALYLEALYQTYIEPPGPDESRDLFVVWFADACASIDELRAWFFSDRQYEAAF